MARLLFWTHFVSAILVPFFRDWGGLDLGQILLLNAWFMFWNCVLEVPTGAVADRFGRRASLLLGLAIGALSILLYVSAPRLEVFLLAEIVIALSYTLISGADEALLYDSLVATNRTHEREARHRPARVREARSASCWARSVARAHAALAAARDPRAPGRADGVRGAGGARPRGAALDGARALARVATPSRARGRRPVLASPALRRLAFDLVSVGALSFLVIWLYQPLLEQAGISIGWFGPVHVALSLGQIAVLQGADRLEDVLGSRSRLLFACALAAGAGWIGLGFARSPWAVVPLVVIVSSFGLARGPLFSASLHRHIPSERRATALSGISMLRTLAIVIANGAAGLGTRVSLSATALAVGVLVVALALGARARPEQL